MDGIKGNPTGSFNSVNHSIGSDINNHFSSYCATRCDSFSQIAPASAKFNGMPIKIEQVTPTFMGGESFSNNGILSVNAWTVEKYLNFGKVVAHLGQAIASSTRETMQYTLDRIVDTALESTGASYCPIDTEATCQKKLEHSSRLLNFLSLATHSRNISGTKEQWQAHLECVRKGKSNPSLPVNRIHREVSGQIIDHIDRLAKLQERLKHFSQRPNTTLATKLEIDCQKIKSELTALYNRVVTDFEQITGDTVESFTELAFDFSDYYCTEETLELPETQQVWEEMTIAEAYGIKSPEQLLELLTGEISALTITDSEEEWYEADDGKVESFDDDQIDSGLEVDIGGLTDRVIISKDVSDSDTDVESDTSGYSSGYDSGESPQPEPGVKKLRKRKPGLTHQLRAT